MVFLSALFTWHGLAAPTKDVAVKRMLSPQSRVMRIVTDDEEQRLLALVNAPMRRAMVIIAVETGLRREEMLALRRSQVSIDQREIHLRGKQTKTRRDRVVPMSARAVEAYKSVNGEGDWVFSNHDGERLRTLDAWWLPLKKAAGLNDVRWHDWRHTFATRFLRATGDIYALARILGHAQITMTTRYLHLVSEDLHVRMRQFDKRT